MIVVGVDPGPEESAYVVYDCKRSTVLRAAKVANATLLGDMSYLASGHGPMVIEMVASYGMPVGREVFETCTWIGRIEQEWVQHSHEPCERLYRQDVKLNLCKSNKANDSTVRQALIDRFGPGREKAIGTKKLPGPLHGITGDCWSALALAVTYHDLTTS